MVSLKVSEYAYFQISVYGNEQNNKEPSYKNTMENQIQASYNFKAFKSEFFIFITVKSRVLAHLILKHNQALLLMKGIF